MGAWIAADAAAELHGRPVIGRCETGRDVSGDFDRAGFVVRYGTRVPVVYVRPAPAVPVESPAAAAAAVWGVGAGQVVRRPPG